MEENFTINKRKKHIDRHELETLSKDELVDKVIQLQAHNVQLKNILQKKLEGSSSRGSVPDSLELDSSKKNKRIFDFSKSHKRHLLLKFLYFGWDYQGLACQEDTNSTIEYHLFKALTRTCLIESRATSNYNRCGRTDKEVSAFCQVVSIDLRSKFSEDEQFTENALQNEIDYCGLLNKVLPKNIQCIAWMPLHCKDYSARFDCKGRTYRYFFPVGGLNIEAMREGCNLLSKAKSPDFRNLCKMDVNNGVTNFKRRIHSATIEECLNQGDDVRFKMCYLEIRANAFLWHQIRCIMAVLLLVGEGKEEPKVIQDLLNVQTNPCKPQYSPATAFPLNLYNCEFNRHSSKNLTEEFCDSAMDTDPPLNNDKMSPDISDWVYSKENLVKLIETIQGEWTEFSIKSTMIRNVVNSLEELLKQFDGNCVIKSQADILLKQERLRHYQSLMTRKRCESLENRIEHFVKKQRIVAKEKKEQLSS